MSSVIHLRRRPTTVEAMYFDGTNGQEIVRWCDGIASIVNDDTMIVAGLHGTVTMKKGDYLIKRDATDYYPCRDITPFYEVVGNVPA